MLPTPYLIPCTQQMLCCRSPQPEAGCACIGPTARARCAAVVGQRAGTIRMEVSGVIVALRRYVHCSALAAVCSWAGLRLNEYGISMSRVDRGIVRGARHSGPN